MNKILIAVVTILVLSGAWFLLFNYSTDYVVVVNDEVSALETELVALDEAFKAGLLTPEEAVVAQASIIKKLASINTTVAANTKATLTDAQKSMLQDGLERLKQTLIKYQGTLLVVDETAADAAENDATKQKGKSGMSGTISDAVTDVVEAVEEHVEAVDDTYTADDEVFELEDIASSSEEIIDDAGEPSDEDTATDGSSDSDSTSSDESDETATTTDMVQ